MALRWFFSHGCEHTPASLRASVPMICQQEGRIGTHEENEKRGLLESSFWGDCTDLVVSDAVCFQAEDFLVLHQDGESAISYAEGLVE